MDISQYIIFYPYIINKIKSCKIFGRISLIGHHLSFLRFISHIFGYLRVRPPFDSFELFLYGSSWELFSPPLLFFSPFLFRVAKKGHLVELFLFFFLRTFLSISFPILIKRVVVRKIFFPPFPFCIS